MSYSFKLIVILLKKFEIFKKVYDERECHVRFYQIDWNKIIYELNKKF